MEKRGQITLFMIVGVIILFVFGFMYFVVNAVQKAKMEAKADEVAQEISEISGLDYYVTLCLKDASVEAIELMGNQGGNIYEDQGGIIPLSSVQHIEYNGFDVTKGITQNPDLGTETFPMPPYYPYRWPNVYHPYPLLMDPDLEFYNPPIDKLFNYYGENTLPHLCEEGGPQDPRVVSEEVRKKLSLVTCGTEENLVGENSVQKQISEFVTKKLKECVNLTYFEEFTGYNITTEEPSSQVIFGKNDVTVKAEFPVYVNISENIFLRKVEFSTTLKARVLKVISLVNSLINYDVQLLDFNLNENPLLTDQTIFVQKINCSLCPHGDYTDILKVTDTQSDIRGKPFVFVTAIRNRIPALEKIPEVPDIAPGLTLETEPYDIVVLQGDTIEIEPKGYDPDEVDPLNFGYEGWQQTYFEYFNEEECLAHEADCRQNPQNYVVEIDRQTYESSYGAVTTWEESITNPPNAKYQTGRKDLGPHELIVKVCDDEALCDWQPVKILVGDRPHLDPEFYNSYASYCLEETHGLYGYCDPKFENTPWKEAASVEEKYVLSTGDSYVLFSEENSYTWEDLTETINGNQHPKVETEFPYHTLKSDKEIKDIHTYDFFKNVLPSPHQLKFTFTTSATFETKDDILIDVYECLPYENPLGSFAPYPYNKLPSEGTSYDDPPSEVKNNPFLADHVCCDSNGEYISGTPCYEYTEYGGFMNFNNNKFTTGLSPNNHLISDMDNEYKIQWKNFYWNDIAETKHDENPFKNGDSTHEAANDIFMRTFTRYCSGERGNICNGEIEEIRKSYEKCGDDFNPGTTRDERCQGPLSGDVVPEGNTLPACFNYKPGQTFESTYLDLPNADGFCNDNYKCSSGSGDNKYGAGGDYRCKAQCDGDGDCDYANACEYCSDQFVKWECDGKGAYKKYKDYVCEDGTCVWKGDYLEKNRRSCNLIKSWTCPRVVCDPYDPSNCWTENNKYGSCRPDCVSADVNGFNCGSCDPCA